MHVKILKTEDMRSGCLRKRRLDEGAKGIIGTRDSEKESAEELSKFLTIIKKRKKDIVIHDGYILRLI